MTNANGNEAESTVLRVREEYSRIAERRVIEDAATRNSEADRGCSEQFGYDKNEIESLPSGADMGLGCGAPVPALDLQPGETVLDLGSGGGIDVFLAARQVGPTGRVIGVDMTPEMIELARDNARRGGYANVEFREGRLEALPVDDGSIDAVTSNCVINLVPDKRAVYAEIARVLRPGGRTVVSDIVLERPLPATLVREMGDANCIVTAIRRDEYLEMIRQAGFAEPEILQDVDYLAAVGWTDTDHMNDETRALLERTGVSYDEIRGTVHSLTLRATKAD
ncbi:MAG: arsenite methyltransferase [bacterium]|nr:arsenite methyltransferase [bacterium]